MENTRSSIPQLAFGESEVPTFYQWSGHCHSSSEFKEQNFLKLTDSEKDLYVCSEEIGVALGDYLATYILKQDFIRDMEEVFAPGCNYWFFKAWEQAAPQYEELDSWVQKIVDLFVANGFIIRFKRANTEYFAFSDLAVYEDNLLPTTLVEKITNICEASLLQFCERHLAEHRSAEGLSNIEVSEWGASIISNFTKNNTN